MREEWRTWWEQGDRQAIAPKTAGTYLFSLVGLLEKNGEQTDYLRHIIRTDIWISEESGSGIKMTKKNKAFCRAIVTQREERLKFQSHHIRLRSLSQWHLDMARNGPTVDAEKHRIKARQIGTCAAFAAVETDVSPLRTNVALLLSYKGQDPWLDLGHDKKSGGHLLVPAAANKNKREISAPMPASSKLRGLETLRWFEREIRPLFNASAENDFFFPAVTDGKHQLVYATFKKWWDIAMIATGFPGMTPHMFRHGQASLIAARNPGNWQLISVRLGDTESTCRAYYTWVNEEQLVLRGQEILTEDFPYAAAA